jgi:hypothetical protein
LYQSGEGGHLELGELVDLGERQLRKELEEAHNIRVLRGTRHVQ